MALGRLPRKKPDDVLRAADWNAVVEAAERKAQAFGPDVESAAGAINMLLRPKLEFYAKILGDDDNPVPCDDFDDARYWVQPVRARHKAGYDPADYEGYYDPVSLRCQAAADLEDFGMPEFTGIDEVESTAENPLAAPLVAVNLAEYDPAGR